MFGSNKTNFKRHDDLTFGLHIQSNTFTKTTAPEVAPHACETFVLLSCAVAAISLILALMSPEMPRVSEFRPLAMPPASRLSRRSGDEWWLRADRGVDACAANVGTVSIQHA